MRQRACLLWSRCDSARVGREVRLEPPRRGGGEGGGGTYSLPADEGAPEAGERPEVSADMWNPYQAETEQEKEREREDEERERRFPAVRITEVADGRIEGSLATARGLGPDERARVTTKGAAGWVGRNRRNSCSRCTSWIRTRVMANRRRSSSKSSC